MLLLCDVGRVESRFGPYGDTVNLDVDRCTVFAERIIGFEIILDTTDCTPRQSGSSGSSFRSIWR
jgi:hypothetical protein